VRLHCGHLAAGVGAACALAAMVLSPAAVHAGQELFVQASRINLRKEPVETSPIIGKLPVAAKVLAEPQPPANEWCLVSATFDGAEVSGYTRCALLGETRLTLDGAKRAVLEQTHGRSTLSCGPLEMAQNAGLTGIYDVGSVHWTLGGEGLRLYLVTDSGVVPGRLLETYSDIGSSGCGGPNGWVRFSVEKPISGLVLGGFLSLLDIPRDRIKITKYGRLDLEHNAQKLWLVDLDGDGVDDIAFRITTLIMLVARTSTRRRTVLVNVNGEWVKGAQTSDFHCSC